jgi:hypothetical protein
LERKSLALPKLERAFQDECLHTLQKMGYAHKQVQDATRCEHCHQVVYPFHKGWADYHAELQSQHYGYNHVIKVECKAGEDRFNFKNLRLDQRLWMKNWLSTNPDGSGWLWLQLGNKRVGSNDPMARRVWMISYHFALRHFMQVMWYEGLKYIPISKEVSADHKMRIDSRWNCEDLFYPYRMEWIGKGCWRPNELHPLYSHIRIKYVEFGINQ